MNLLVTHTHPVCSELHNSEGPELYGKGVSVADDEATRLARDDYSKNPSKDNLLALANALAHQLRYREAKAIYLSLLNEGMDTRSKIALCSMKTGSPEEAVELYTQLLDDQDPLYEHYRLGLSLYFCDRLLEAKEHFLACYPYCREDGEMYIAILYWHMCTALRLHQGKDEVASYDMPLDHGHHVGYNAAVRYWLDDETEIPFEEIDALDDINRSCLYYGLAQLQEENSPRKEEFLKKAMMVSSIWGSFAYLGAYYETRDK